MIRSARLLSLIGRFARLVYLRAGAVVVPSPGFKRNLIGKGLPEHRIHFIPNYCDERVFYPAPVEPELADSLGLADRFNVMFAGNIGIAQQIDVVLAAADLLRDLQDVQFVLVGGGVDVPRLKRQASARGMGNVLFIDRQPADMMPRLFALAAVLLVHLRDDPLFEITIPSKIYAYMACGRPILMAGRGDAVDAVSEVRSGHCCAPGDPAALAEAVRMLYWMKDSEREEMGRRGREAYLEHYTRDAVAGRYERLFQQVLE